MFPLENLARKGFNDINRADYWLLKYPSVPRCPIVTSHMLLLQHYDIVIPYVEINTAILSAGNIKLLLDIAYSKFKHFAAIPKLENGRQL